MVFGLGKDKLNKAKEKKPGRDYPSEWIAGLEQIKHDLKNLKNGGEMDPILDQYIKITDSRIAEFDKFPNNPVATPDNKRKWDYLLRTCGEGGLGRIMGDTMKFIEKDRAAKSSYEKIDLSVAAQKRRKNQGK
ncbi:MAG: hypothetical protein FWD15_06040 [Alphaproteobacteria bacterium]|nr:hypothetical protein [Alphaproteobacteria bacterium]